MQNTNATSQSVFFSLKYRQMVQYLLEVALLELLRVRRSIFLSLCVPGACPQHCMLGAYR